MCCAKCFHLHCITAAGTAQVIQILTMWLQRTCGIYLATPMNGNPARRARAKGSVGEIVITRNEETISGNTVTEKT